MAFFREDKVIGTTKPKEVFKNPNDKIFFGLHFTGDLNTKRLGIAGQFLSGITEFVALVNLIGFDFPITQLSNLPSYIIGLIGVYVFEWLGVRVYLVSVVRTIAKWNKKDENGNVINKKNEAVFLLIMNVLLLVAIMLGNMKTSMMGESSIFFSKKNQSQDERIFRLEEERDVKILKIEDKHNEKESDNLDKYNEDKQEIISTYKSDVKDEIQRNKLSVASLEKSKWNSPAIQFFDKKINEENQLHSKNLSALKNAKNNELERLDSKYIIDNSSKERLIAQIKKSYQTKINAIESKTERENSFWAYVDGGAMILLIVFIVISWIAIIYDEVFKSGAEMEILIEDVESKPNLIELLVERVGNWLYHLAYVIIISIFGTTKFSYKGFEHDKVDYKVKKKSFARIGTRTWQWLAGRKKEEETIATIGYKTDVSICDTKELPKTETTVLQSEFWSKHTRNKIRNYFNRGILGKSSAGKRVGEKSKKDNLKRLENTKIEAAKYGIDLDKEMGFTYPLNK